ncbi:MAG: hypothetical protein Q4G26_03785 [Paracoccus sp. (in: a-proteobacteria)]|nr:hypothetical protein [Paracoccus sp. (in: a-proteobacteria)]
MKSTPPTPLLLDGIDPNDWEASSVCEKFSSSAATFGEENADYVAIGYMSYPAVAYWLPHLLAYLRSDAPVDSFHFESVLHKLADNDWSIRLQDELSNEEKLNISNFLEWLGGQAFMVKSPALRTAAYNYAIELWHPDTYA